MLKPRNVTGHDGAQPQPKRIEVLNSFSSFIYGLKTQLDDQECFGGKISDDDKTVLATVMGTAEWVVENGWCVFLDVVLDSR